MSVVRGRDDDGFGSVFLLAQLGLAALLCVAFADAANVLVARARAQTAADAAALAAAVAQWRDGDELPGEAARAIATANGAELDACRCERHAPTATVTVGRGTSIRLLGVAPRRVTASATASVDVARLFAPP